MEYRCIHLYQSELFFKIASLRQGSMAKVKEWSGRTAGHLNPFLPNWIQSEAQHQRWTARLTCGSQAEGEWHVGRTTGNGGGWLERVEGHVTAQRAVHVCEWMDELATQGQTDRHAHAATCEKIKDPKGSVFERTHI